MTTGAPLLTSFAKAKEIVDSHREEIVQARQLGKPVVWHTVEFPSQLFAAYDVVPIAAEWYSAASGPSQGVDLLEAIEDCGFPHEMCAYGRMCLGSMVANRGFLGEFPKPDLVLGAEGVCNLEGKWFELMARYYNVPFFIMDFVTAHVYDANWEDASREAVEYFVQKSYRFIHFMEQATGQKPNEEKLVNTLVTSRRNAQLWMEIADLWQMVPSPITFKNLLTYLPVGMGLGGRPEGTQLLRDLRDELAQRVRDGVSAIPDERMRLYWDVQPPWYHTGLLRFVESKGAAIVASFYFGSNLFLEEAFGRGANGWLLERLEPTNLRDCLWEIGKMEVATQRHLQSLAGSCVRGRIAQTIAMVKKAKVDGLIFCSPRICRRGADAQLDTRNAVRQELGLPTLVLETSPSDPRDYSKSAVELTISTFLEQVMADKERRVRSG